MSEAVSTNREGVLYIPSWVIQGTSTDAITARQIQAFTTNIFGRLLFERQRILASNGKPTITVKPLIDSGELSDLAAKLQARIIQIMFAEKVDLNSAVVKILSDGYFYGPTVFNWVWDLIGTECVLTELNHLPTYTFDTCPIGRETYSRLLPGFTFDPKTGEHEYWQTDGTGKVTQLDNKNLFVLVDPCSDELTGIPYIKPILPVIEMLGYTLNASLQAVNRNGAPIFFIKITNPQPANEENGMLSDEDYAAMIIANWGKDTAFPLRENMSIEYPKFGTSTITKDTFDMLVQITDDYSSPGSMIGGRGSAGMSGASSAEFQLLSSYIKGIMDRIENSLSQLCNQYLIKNGYTDLIASVTIPHIAMDQSQLLLLQATLLLQYKLISVNEARIMCGQTQQTDEEFMKMLEEWKQVQEATAPPSPFGLTAGPADPEEPVALPAEQKNSFDPEVYKTSGEYAEKPTSEEAFVKDLKKNFRTPGWLEILANTSQT